MTPLILYRINELFLINSKMSYDKEERENAFIKGLIEKGSKKDDFKGNVWTR